jgi:two-component sensor histidine kinase
VVRTLIKQLRAKLTVTGEGGAQFRLNWKLSDDAPNGILPI